MTDIQSGLNDDAENCNTSEYYVDFNNFLQVGNYLAIVYKDVSTGEVYSELLKVYCVDGYDVIAIKPKDYHDSKDYEILRFGFAENYNRGITVKDKHSLFSYNGLRSCCVKQQCPVEPEYPLTDDEVLLSFELDFPYENLPNYIKKGQYFENEIFFIQQKLQISYTFKIVETRKEDSKFNSYLVNDGSMIFNN
jgi:hypothetical protein